MKSCLEYRGRRHSRGYGYLTLEPGKRVMLHRWIVEQVDGRPLEPGEVVRHKCDNPPCFRYDHLERGTQADNIDDMIQKGRGYNQKKTHCPQGHEYNYRFPDGRRGCLVCINESSRRSRERRDK